MDWGVKVMPKSIKKLIKSQRDISQIPRPDKKDHHPCGDSLFIRVEPLKDEGLSMSFVVLVGGNCLFWFNCEK